MTQVPGFQGTVQDTPRVMTRGKLEFLLFGFFADQAKTIPVVPLDPQQYPNFRILAPDGSLMVQGTAVPATGPGLWKAGWVVPKSAPLTNPYGRYRFAITMVDPDLRQYEASYEFDVVESAVEAQTPQHQQLMTFQGVPLRVTFDNTLRPDYLTVMVTPYQQDTNPVFAAALRSPQPVTPGPTDIVETQQGNHFVYYVDLPGLAVGAYTASWTVRDTAVSPTDVEATIIQVIAPSTMHQIKSIRMVVDKLQKKLGLVTAYDNEQLLECLQRGVDMVNGYWPPSTWTITQVPQSLAIYSIIAGCWWALESQRILYAETNLNFCVDLNTLLPTPHGLIRASALVTDQAVELRQNIAKQLTYGLEMQLFDQICDRFGDHTRTQEMVDGLGLEQGAISLGGLFTRFTLNQFKTIDTKGHPVWEVSRFRQHLGDRYGMFHERLEGSYETTQQLLTPYGFARPEQVWYLKDKPVYRVENELGYDLIATGNHPILVLDPDTFEVTWRDLDQVQPGDLVALNTAEAEEEDWEVSLTDHVGAVIDTAVIDTAVIDTRTPKTLSPYSLPERMTPELARLCGYLVAAEGCFTSYDFVSFSNNDLQIIEDFKDCCLRVFGRLPTYLGVPKTGYEGQFKYNKDLHLYKLDGVELRRFFFSLGMGYEKSREQKIPDVVLRSPKHIAKEFLVGLFEGDGCFAESDVIFSSTSCQLLSDIQQLLLRFGIVAKKFMPKGPVCGKVSVRGLSLVRYRDKIGFRYKGADFTPKTVYRPQREAINPEILRGLIGLRRHLSVNEKGWAGPPGDRRRIDIYWQHKAKGGRHITWDHVDAWMADKGETVKRLNPVIWGRIAHLLETRFLWKKVTQVECLGRRDVIDPSFAGVGNLLDHAFVTNGLITHNSGQSVTLEYNPGADIESAMQGLKDTIDNRLTAIKKNVVRSSRAVGSVATRPYRYRSSMVFKIDAGSSNIVQDMILLGILD
jgi:hypothetical protein